jgi:UDP-N-acetylmuramate dehydrogenase
MKIEELEKLLKDFKKNLVFNKNLKNKSWFNIGGKAKVFFKAENLDELIRFLKKIDNKEKIFVLGAGSNTLISDKFFDGIVLQLAKDFSNISLLNENIIISGSAVLDRSLSNFAMMNNISGFEYLSGIPGTVGGAIKMNAGCFGKEIRLNLLSVQAIDRIGNIKTIYAKDIIFDYRANDLSEDLIFLSASFKGKKSNHKEIKKEIDRIILEKKNSQPSRIKTCGSTFKNPLKETNKKVWELINDSVPENLAYGDACISKKHKNFFINRGNASFTDMSKLIDHVSNAVFDKYGIRLEKEIKILK